MSNMPQAVGYREWTVGDRLRAARESAGFPERKQWAAHLGLSVDAVLAYERDELHAAVNGRKPKIKPPTLTAWCLASGFSREWILTGTVPDGGPRPTGRKAERSSTITTSSQRPALVAA